VRMASSTWRPALRACGPRGQPNDSMRGGGSLWLAQESRELIGPRTCFPGKQPGRWTGCRAGRSLQTAGSPQWSILTKCDMIAECRHDCRPVRSGPGGSQHQQSKRGRSKPGQRVRQRNGQICDLMQLVRQSRHGRDRHCQCRDDHSGRRSGALLLHNNLWSLPPTPPPPDCCPSILMRPKTSNTSNFG
jgi:hypothetical protein